MQAQRGCPPWLGSGEGVNGDTVAEAPTLGTTLRKGRRAQAQIGNRWGHRARPETPDPQGGVGGKAGGEGGRPLPGSQSRAVLLPRCGFENSRAETGNAEAPGVLGAWRGVWGGAETLTERRGHRRGLAPHLLPPLAPPHH